MTQLAIVAEKLGKKYPILHQRRDPYQTLSGTLATMARSSMRRLTHPFSINTERSSLEMFEALRDVTFCVKPGERLGIIGRNGSGKTTLLKVLSRITSPSSGRARIRGRVASLLEVGTGFHPELTGRENIYLNGVILGMSKSEVKAKFEEIVDFAEVEKFLDTPVKRYSSGMHVRLAFGVAAFLEPEILIIDEVLAVGDLKFQKKCLGRMEQVGQDGRTVLLVSHQMDTIRKFCSRCLWLHDGTIKEEGETNGVIRSYETTSLLCGIEGG